MCDFLTGRRSDSGAVENFITAAIISAREGYRDSRWLFWAENWMNGRDRSYESAQLAHRQARSVYLRELSESAAGVDCQQKPIETLSDETAAERAAWAASLALITAPMAPDLTGFFLRFEATVKDRLGRLLAGHTLPWQATVSTRWTSFARGA